MLISHQGHKNVYLVLERLLPTHPKRWTHFLGSNSKPFPANTALTFILRLEVLSQTCKYFLSCFLWMLKESLDPHSPEHKHSFSPITYLPVADLHPHLSVTFSSDTLSSKNSSPWFQPEQLGSFRVAGSTRSRVLTITGKMAKTVLLTHGFVLRCGNQTLRFPSQCLPR